MMIGYAKECRSIFPVLREEALALHNPTAVLQSLTTQFAGVPAIKTTQARIEEIRPMPDFQRILRSINIRFRGCHGSHSIWSGHLSSIGRTHSDASWNLEMKD
jgi:hypothetical protein